MGERRGACRILVEKPEGKRRIGIRRRRWDDDINVSLRNRIVDVDWIDLSQDTGFGQVVDSCEYGNELSCSIKCGEVLNYLTTYQLRVVSHSSARLCFQIQKTSPSSPVSKCAFLQHPGNLTQQ
jgi:hypothetical protein